MFQLARTMRKLLLESLFVINAFEVPPNVFCGNTINYQYLRYAAYLFSMCYYFECPCPITFRDPRSIDTFLDMYERMMCLSVYNKDLLYHTVQKDFILKKMFQKSFSISSTFGMLLMQSNYTNKIDTYFKIQLKQANHWLLRSSKIVTKNDQSSHESSDILNFTAQSFETAEYVRDNVNAAALLHPGTCLIKILQFYWYVQKKIIHTHAHTREISAPTCQP